MRFSGVWGFLFGWGFLMHLLFQRINWKSPKNLQFSCSCIPKNSLPRSTAVRLFLFKKNKNFHWGYLISLGPSSALCADKWSQSTEPQTTEAIQPPFISMIYVKSVVKLKPANKHLLICSFFKYRSPLVTSGASGTSDVPGPTVPGCSRGEHSYRSSLSTKIHKEAQSPNIIII